MNNEKKSILIADDEKFVRDQLKKKLTLEGFVVHEASDGGEAFALAKEKLPDLIVLDIMMPVFDGLTVLEKIRQEAWGQEMPVIMLTSLNPDEHILKKINTFKSSYYLVKSDWKLEDIVGKIKERLKDK